jgi:cell division protein FtsL
MPKSQPLPPMTSDPMPNGRDNQNSPKKTRLFSAKNNDTTVKNNTTMKKSSEGLGTSISEMLDTEYRGVSIYTVAMMLLVIAILWTGVSVVEQIQTYHQQYG